MTGGLGPRSMNLGVFNHGWWANACRASDRPFIELPIASSPNGNAYCADLRARLELGDSLTARLQADLPDVFLDNGGTGLNFIPTPQADNHLQCLHESFHRPLISHFIDPVTTTYQGLDSFVLWQSLQSPTWIKAVWDKAHANELRQFGVPGVLHLPMAAPDREYDTRPVDLDSVRPLVSFVGGQNTSYFSSGQPVPTSSLFAGTLAQAMRSDIAGASFYDVYHNQYGLAAPVLSGDPPAVRAKKLFDYYNAKLFFHAQLCLQNRDRFVISLMRRIPDRFELIGARWDSTYGLKTAPPLPSTDEYFRHFRRTAINLNLVNGNAETGLNMRHFEITAAGGFMLCRAQPELSDCFVIGKECAVFTDERDLLDKIDYFLAHPCERESIALAGQKRTLSQHLYNHRLHHLLRQLTAPPPPVSFATAHWLDDCKRFVPRPDVILDCGANTGQSAIGLRRKFPSAAIYSFEPVRTVFDQLQRNCAPLNVHAINKAVGDRDGRTSIRLTTSHEANSLLDYQPGNPCAQWTWIVGTEDIEVCTLDRWCEESGIDSARVQLIKLDVQGAELQALYGAKQLLKHVPLIYLEVSFVPIYKDAPLFPEIDSFLTECGYARHAVYPSDQPHNWGDASYVKLSGMTA